MCNLNKKLNTGSERGVQQDPRPNHQTRSKDRHQEGLRQHEAIRLRPRRRRLRRTRGRRGLFSKRLHHRNAQ